MDIGSAVTQGLIGMQRAQNEIAYSAQQIARASGTREQPVSADVDLVEPLINIKAQTQVFDSSAKVIKAASDSIGTLLNIKA